MKTLGVSNPALVNGNHPALRAAVFAFRKGFGSKPVFLRSGGSVPAASIFQKRLGIPTVLMGFALPGDRIHAPNEKFHLPNFYRGIKTSIWHLRRRKNWEILAIKPRRRKRCAHDYRLPLPCGERRPHDRPMEHGRANRTVFTPRTKSGNRQDGCLRSFSQRLRLGQPAGSKHRRTFSPPADWLCLCSRLSRCRTHFQYGGARTQMGLLRHKVAWFRGHAYSRALRGCESHQDAAVSGCCRTGRGHRYACSSVPRRKLHHSAYG